jgi:hypothetical protein
MRFVMALAIVSTLALTLPETAEAQARLPRTSPAERTTKDINRRIQQDQRILGVEQDIRSESSRIRQTIERDRMFSNPPPAPLPSRRGTCPRGSIGC